MGRKATETARAAPRPLAGRLGMPRLSSYILGQMLGPVALLSFLMTSVIWLIEVLPLLDLVINRGQSAPTFLYLILLLLPTLLMIIMPIAFFFGALVTLQRLWGDSELVVMASAGYSLRQLCVPVMTAAAIVMALTYACALWLAPVGQRALSDKLLDIRADMAGALLNEGEFNNMSQGLTVFIRRLASNGEIQGILVHNNEDKRHPVTYIAEKGILAQTPVGTRLIMLDGTVETASKNGAQLQVLHFESYTINMDQFSGPARATLRKIQERYLNELLWPSEPNLDQKTRNRFLAEAHSRLSQPLYCLTFALIALAAVLRGRRQRGSVAMRLTLASLIAAGLRIAGYGVAGLAQRYPALSVVFYLIPFIGGACATLVLVGYSPRALLARWRSAHAAGAA